MRTIEERIRKGYPLTLIVLPRMMVETFKPNVDFAIISITEPGQNESSARVIFPDTDRLKDKLELVFWDVEKPILRYVELFTEEHAEQICDFTEKIVAEGIKFLVVHCEAGVSRSSATAETIDKYVNGSNEEWFTNQPDYYRPNGLVKRLLSQEYEKRRFFNRE